MRKQINIFLLLVFITIISGTYKSQAQSSIRDSSLNMVLIAPSYGYQIPAGDMAKRFGANSSIGLSVMVKRKSNWMFIADGFFIFGNKFNQPGLFDDIATPQGFVIGSNGYYGNILIAERGYNLTLSVGRLFPMKKPNPNCGIFVQAGAGFLQHKISIIDKKGTVPALQGEYVKGYDHLTNGLALREFVGYVYVGNRRLVNFFGGFEAVQGFTEGRRSYNFNTKMPDSGKRLDLLFGLRFGWIMPIYKQAPEKYYIY